jgi:hypothetical protein
MLYFAPGTTDAQLRDTALPVIIAEGEFKTLAVWRLANWNCVKRPRFVPVGVSGVYNWRGTIGKTAGPDGERLDVKGPIPDLERIAWKDRRVIIAYDADADEKDLVRFARAELARHLRTQGAVVGFLAWNMNQGKGIDDHLAVAGPDAVLDELARVPFTGLRWQDELLRSRVSSENSILPILANAITALRLAPEWQGLLAYDEFRCNVVALKPPPWSAVLQNEWTDQEDRLTAEWLQRHRILVSVEIGCHSAASPSPPEIFRKSEMGGHPAPGSLAFDLSWCGSQQLFIGGRIALDLIRRGANLSSRREGGLLPDLGGTARNQEINRAANACWRILHRRAGRLRQQRRRTADSRRLDC